MLKILSWFTLFVRYKPGKVVVNSELPLGAGLGSSAAFCVSLTAALLSLSDSSSVDLSSQGWLVLGERELELVNNWAFGGEKIIHGRPSGIDNTVSTFGMYSSIIIGCIRLHFFLCRNIAIKKMERKSPLVLSTPVQKRISFVTINCDIIVDEHKIVADES